METPTSRQHSVAGAGQRILGTGAAALLAAGPWRRVPARRRPPTRPIGATGSVAALSALEHGSAERQQRPDHRELDVDDDVLQDGHRVGQRRGRRRLRHCDRHRVEEVQDHDRGAQHHA